jgi:regulator of sirC expression with transglutaminase-like and TPR domain
LTRNFEKILNMILWVLLFTSLSFSQQKIDIKYNPIAEYNGQTIWKIKDVPEENIDIGLWALIIAKEFDHSIDVNKYLAELDMMKVEILKMVGNRENDLVKFLMTRMFIYETGQWNDRPFSYDLNDPLGEHLENQLLSSYIDNRKGNCISMPTLFLALMERVDPEIRIYGNYAPLHLFCRFYDRESGDVWNVETTNGGNPARNIWYIETLGISKTAIDSGAYMQDLTKKQYIGELLNTLVSKYRRIADYEKAMQYVDLMLELNPKSIAGFVHKGALFSWYGHLLVEKAKNEHRILKESEQTQVRMYKSKSDKYIEKAKSLGWQPQSKQQREDYLNEIKNEKSKNALNRGKDKQ